MNFVPGKLYNSIKNIQQNMLIQEKLVKQDCKMQAGVVVQTNT